MFASKKDSSSVLPELNCLPVSAGFRPVFHLLSGIYPILTPTPNAVSSLKKHLQLPKIQSTFAPMVKPNQTPCLNQSQVVVSDPAIIRRVEITCELFELAFEIKYLELKRQNPKASYAWLRLETLRLIELGTR